LISAVAGPEEAKEPQRGKNPPPDSDPLKRRRVWKNLANLSRQIRRNRESALPAQEKHSAFHPHAQRNALQASLRLLVSIVRTIGGYKQPFPIPEKQSVFIRVRDETSSIVSVRIHNPDCSPLAIQGRDAIPTPTGFAEIVGDDFPILHDCQLVENYRARHSVTHPTHLKFNGYSHGMDAT
jgi:hypothetical protein